MSKIIEILARVDMWLIIIIRKGVCALDEWLSVSQHKIERFLIVAVFIFIVLNGIFVAKHLPWFVRPLVIVNLLIVPYNIYRFHALSDERRVIHLLYPPAVLGRIVISIIFVVSCLQMLIPPVRFYTIFYVIAMLLSILVIYVTAMPRNPGSRGRRRKEALKKLRDKLGGFVPSPEPLPQP